MTLPKSKQKTCKNCGDKFKPVRPLQIACSNKCAIEWGYKLKEKKQAKEQAQERKKMKDNIVTLSELQKLLQAEINRIVRLIDEGCPCISSGKKPVKVNAGHYYSRSVSPWLRFHLFNIWLQSEYANTYLHGDLVNYTERLKSIDILEFIQSENIQWRDLKLTKDQLIEATGTAKMIIKELKKLNEFTRLPRSIEERIMLRKRYNTLLNIYT